MFAKTLTSKLFLALGTPSDVSSDHWCPPFIRFEGALATDEWTCAETMWRDAEPLWSGSVILGASPPEEVNEVGRSLAIAAGEGRDSVVNRLIRFGMPADGVGDHEFTPLGFAARNGRLSCLKVLVAAGADVNHVHRGYSAIVLAVVHGHSEAVRFLLSVGADPNSSDGCEKTLVYLAARWGYPEVLRTLADGGAELLPRDQTGHTPLDMGCQRSSSSLVRIVTYLTLLFLIARRAVRRRRER